MITSDEVPLVSTKTFLLMVWLAEGMFDGLVSQRACLTQMWTSLSYICLYYLLHWYTAMSLVPVVLKRDKFALF